MATGAEQFKPQLKDLRDKESFKAEFKDHKNESEESGAMATGAEQFKSQLKDLRDKESFKARV